MSATFEGAELELELVDPHALRLVRLFRHPQGDWTPPPPEFRNQRADAPAGHEKEYALLYTADSLEAAAIECRILNCDVNDHYTYHAPRAAQYAVARYQMHGPAIFLPLDGDNKVTLGLRGVDAKYERHRAVSYQLFTRFGAIVQGLSWESYHRNQPGRVYALWHHHKETVGLSVTPFRLYPNLVEDPEWLDLLRRNPDFEAAAP